MSNLTKPPILDDTGQDILTALGAIKQNLPQGGGSNGYAPTDATEATLADDDKMPFYDTSASGKRNSTWSNIKSKLQSFFETIFVTIASLDGTVFVEKTYAEYEALSEAQKNDGKVEYFITDLDDIDYAVQDDPTSTDLVNDEVPTGGTIESVLNSKLVDNSSVTGFEFRKSKTNVVTVTRTGSPVLSTDGITVNAQIPVGYRPSVEARAVGKVYNGSSYVDCTIGFGADGYIKIRTLTGSAVSGIQTSFMYPTFVTYVV